MPVIPHVVRRGAIYYWRKRLPRSTRCKSGMISVSLRTADARLARMKAARLTSDSIRVFERARLGMLTTEQLSSIMKMMAHDVDELLAFEAAEDRKAGGLSPRGMTGLTWSENAAVMAEVNRRRASVVSPDDPQRVDDASLRARGWSDVMIERFHALYPPPPFFGPRAFRDEQLAILAHEAGVHQELTDQLLSEIDVAALRGSAAAYEKHSRWLAAGPDEDLEIAFGAEAGALRAPSFVQAPPTPPQYGHAVAPAPAVLTTAPTTQTPIADIIQLLLDDKHADQDWDTKAEKQAISVLRLFTGYLEAEFGLSHFEGITQGLLDSFDGMLKTLNPGHGKAAEDAGLSPERYIQKYTPPRSKHTEPLSARTRNRYWVTIGQLVARAKKRGLDTRHLEPNLFRSRAKSGDARNEREKPSPEQMRAFFSSPLFTGCAGYEDRKKGGLRPMDTPGEQIFHRAAYFVPIIMAYHGFRREEACGLAVDDVVDATETPSIKIRENGHRRIKNAQSEREHALHPEVIRLGFLQYVAKIRALGYRRVFPDLVSSSSSSPSGDRLYDELEPLLKQHGITPHQFRHFFDNALKQKKVMTEIREDLMGHKGVGESSSRYADALHVEHQLEDLTKIDDVTGHLRSAPIELLPWVQQKKPTPWSRSTSRRLQQPSAQPTPPKRLA